MIEKLVVFLLYQSQGGYLFLCIGIDAHSINEMEDWVKQNKGW